MNEGSTTTTVTQQNSDAFLVSTNPPSSTISDPCLLVVFAFRLCGVYPEATCSWDPIASPVLAGDLPGEVQCIQGFDLIAIDFEHPIILFVFLAVCACSWALCLDCLFGCWENTCLEWVINFIWFRVDFSWTYFPISCTICSLVINFATFLIKRRRRKKRCEFLN